ncbi:MAG: hypothetical protein WCJ21_09120 [Planctomycetota bacterium]
MKKMSAAGGRKGGGERAIQLMDVSDSKAPPVFLYGSSVDGVVGAPAANG